MIPLRRLRAVARSCRRWLLTAAPVVVLAAPPAVAAPPALAEQRLPRAVPGTHAPAPQSLRPALWMVGDEDTRIYLFGTIHVLEPGLQWFDGPVAEAFQSADSLVTEVATVGGLDAAQALLQSAMLPEGQTLRGKLSPDDRAALDTALGKAGIPAAAIDRFKPWYAAVMLSSLPLMRAGYRLDQGVEMQLAKRARAVGKKQDALETAAFQLGLFESLPEKTQLTYLRQVVANLDQVTSQIGTLVSEWGQGDAEGLAAAMNADKSDPLLIEALLTRRNQAWAEWIGRRLAQPGTVFVAVGAGHLAGPGSVQSLLATRGITSTRVQ